ncbi:MAG: hypothetical protein KJZ47_09970 [Gemmatimonadales bacterium]|nr:hypothetical protein [Gemmatimonadales bacterium]
MAIDPLASSGVPDPSMRRADPSVRPDAPVPARGGSAEAAPETPADSVELSAEARRLAAGSDIPVGTLSPERLAAITRTLAEGGFDTHAAHDAIARALRGELSTQD